MPNKRQHNYPGRVHAQGVKQSVCPSVVIVVVVGTKVSRSCVLGICVCCKHNQSVDIGENWFVRTSNCLKRLTSATNCAFSVQHAYGLSTTPTLLAFADATGMLKLSVGKSRQVIKQLCSRMLQYYTTVATERAVCALQSSSYYGLCCMDLHVQIDIKVQNV